MYSRAALTRERLFRRPGPASFQLRQIATAGLAWANDNNGRLPDQVRWYSSSQGDSYSFFSYLGFPDTGQQMLRDTVYTCPVFQKEFPTAVSPHRTYAISRYALGSAVGDTAHGSSYFLRWNRVRARSGGLGVHKSCHHLDVLNWWIHDWPETVFAFGARNFYGPDGAHRPRSANGEGLSSRETKEQCPYFQKHYVASDRPGDHAVMPARGRLRLPYDMQYPPDKATYLYDEEIDIEDTYSALVRYRGGALLNYSINFSAAWEGLNVGINGTHGRIEGSYRVPAGDSGEYLDVMPLFDTAYRVAVEKGMGSHGGADAPLQRDLFRAESEESREVGLMAGSVAGAYAVAAGEAIGLSCLRGVPIAIPVFE